MIDFRWFKIDDSEMSALIGMDSSNLNFNPLMASNAGVYACNIEVSSSYVDGTINQTSRHTTLTITRKQ